MTAKKEMISMIDKVNLQEVAVNKILVAVDGSPSSIRGIEHAVQLAKEKNADLIALHVDTTFSDMDSKGYGALAIQKSLANGQALKDTNNLDSDITDILERHYKELGKPAALIKGEAGLEVAEFLAEKRNVKVKTRVERGQAVKTIVEIAGREDAGMIVVGSKGLTGFDRMMLGSIAEKVSKFASCPVLIVR